MYVIFKVFLSAYVHVVLIYFVHAKIVQYRDINFCISIDRKLRATISTFMVIYMYLINSTENFYMCL